MSGRRKQAQEAAVLPVARLYERLAWLQWHGAYQEANAVAELAAWFVPPVQIDEDRVARLVAELGVTEAAA